MFSGRVQSFAEPVPGWPVGQEALLKALAEWVRAEAADVRIASPRGTVCVSVGLIHAQFDAFV